MRATSPELQSAKYWRMRASIAAAVRPASIFPLVMSAHRLGRTCFGRNGRSGQPRLAALEHIGVFEAVPGALHVWRWRRLILVKNVVADEAARDAELRVGFEQLVIAAVHLRGDSLEPWLVDECMQVRRPERMAPLHGEQLARRPTHRHRIARRLHGAVAKGAFRIGEEPAAQIPLGL